MKPFSYANDINRKERKKVLQFKQKKNLLPYIKRRVMVHVCLHYSHSESSRFYCLDSSVNQPKILEESKIKIN